MQYKMMVQVVSCIKLGQELTGSRVCKGQVLYIRVGEHKQHAIRVSKCKGWLELVGLAGRGACNVRDVTILAILSP